MVQGSFLENAPVFAVSAKSGEGLESLRNGILDLLSSIPEREVTGMFRLPVDRVFTLKGHGTVITGTLMSGRIRKEDSAEILPSHRRTKIRSIHAHNMNVSEAFAGQRTAVNLQGIEKEEIARGHVLTEPGYFDNSSLLDAKITMLAHSRPLLHNALVRFHHLTTDMLARVTLIGRDSISGGENGFVQLRLQKPAVAVYGDRFILRRQSPLITIGGGVILDAMPVKRAVKGDPAARKRLELLENASIEDRFVIAAAEKGPAGAEENWLKVKLNLSVPKILKVQTDEIIILREHPLLAISTNSEEFLLKKILDAVASFHQTNPLLPGIPKEELRSKFLSFVPAETFLATLERGVSQKKLQIQKDLIALFDRKVSLSSEEEQLSLGVEDALVRSGLEFPGFDRIAEDLNRRAEEIRKHIYVLVRQGIAVKIGEDYFVHRKNWEDLKQRIRALKSTKKRFSVPDFKTLFGVTRKYAIPLMEQMDREGVTRRSGNERIIV